MALGKEGFADRNFAEAALPRAALGKGFAEGLRGFVESLGPSAKQPAPVVVGLGNQVCGLSRVKEGWLCTP
jgi:hypothetical protein